MLNQILIIILSITNFLSVKIIIEHKKEISELKKEIYPIKNQSKS